MRNCLTKFSCIFEFGAVQKRVHIVDLVESFQTSIYYLVLAKIGVDTAVAGPLKVCQQQPKVRKQIITNIGLTRTEEQPHQREQEDARNRRG